MLTYKKLDGSAHQVKKAEFKGNDDQTLFIYDHCRERLLHIRDRDIFTFNLSENSLVRVGYITN